MDINLKANKQCNLKELLKINHFSPKLITILEREGLNTLINLNEGESIKISLPPEKSDIKPETGLLNIVYEDDYLIILNKDSNIASIPSIKHYDHNLANILLDYYKKNNIYSTIHPVTRLDYKTDGLIIFAKHRYIHNLFSHINIDKYYRATLEGILNISKGYISLPISDNDTMIREINKKGKKALTYFEVTSYGEDSTNVNIKLLTGRTHQIRRHFSYLGFPIVGDNLYGNSKDILKLTCYRLSFIHPINKTLIDISI